LVVLRSRVFLGGQAVSMLGDGLAILAVPLLVLQLTRSPVAAVLASLPGSVGYLAAFAVAGALTLLTVAAAWFAALQKVPAAEVANGFG
jgi:hypothetical protein